MNAEIPVKFHPSSIFQQTCGSCGAVFRVEVERQKVNGDLREYQCPACHHHVCRVNTSTDPRVTLISTGAAARSRKSK